MASLYWVGGTATWDAVAGTKWASTSGGVGGQPVPTAADDVFLDAASGTVTVTAGAATVSCNNFDCTGFTGTFSLNTGFSLETYGTIFKLVAGMTWTQGAGSYITFRGNGNCAFTAAGKPLGHIQIGLSGSTGTVTCQDNLASVGTSQIINLASGIFDTNNKNITCGQFVSNGAGTRTLNLGSSTITITGDGGAWFCPTVTNMTFNPGTSTIIFTGNNIQFYGQLTYNNVVANNSGYFFLGRASTFANLTRTGTAVKTDALASSFNITVTGTLTLNSNSATNRLIVQSYTGAIAPNPGSAITVTAAALVCTNVIDFMDITGAGAATWTTAVSGATYFGDCGGNSGITTTTPATQTATGTASFTWSTHGWTSRVPLPQDDVVINNAFVAGRTITVDMPRIGKSIDLSGCTGSPAFTWGIPISSFGNVAMASGVVPSGGTNTWTFGGRGSQTITNNGVTWANATRLSVTAPGGTYSLQDALVMAASGSPSLLAVTVGTLDFNNFNVTTGQVSASTGAALIPGTSTITLNGTSNGNIINIATGATFNGAATTIIVGAHTVSQTFTGGNKTYGTVTYTAANSPGQLVVANANTFNTLNIGSGRILTMPSSTTNAINTWNVNGAVNGYVYLPGVGAACLSTPDSVANSITGDLDARVRVALDKWTPANNATLFDKMNFASNNAWQFAVLTDGRLFAYISHDGVWGNTQNAASTANVSAFADGSTNWVRMTYRASDGRIQFFTASGALTNPVAADFTQLGADRTVTSGGIYDSSLSLGIGDIAGTGSPYPTKGKLYRAQLRNGIDGTLAFDADLTTKPFGANTFTESSANAATVTINGALAQAGDGRVSLVSSTPGSAATLTKPNGTVSCDYLTIQDSSATGASWFAGPNSVNVSNNTGWIFSGAPPTRPSGFYPFFR